MIDFYTAKKTDLVQIEGVFRLDIKRSGKISAFTTYFQVHFSKCHVPVMLSMEPEYSGTFWKQTVFLLPDSMLLQVRERDEVYGVFRLISKPENFRDFDFLIDVCYRGERLFFKDSTKYKLR